MKLADHARLILGLPENYDKESLASLCVLFGIPKEELEQEYKSYTPEEIDKVHMESFKQIMRRRSVKPD